MYRVRLVFLNKIEIYLKLTKNKKTKNSFMFRRLKIIIFYSSLLFCSPNYLMNLLPHFHLLLFHSLIPFFSHSSLTSLNLFHSLIQLFSFLAYLTFYSTLSLCSFPIPCLPFLLFHSLTLLFSHSSSRILLFSYLLL